MAVLRMNEARLRVIKSRQWAERFGRDYQPAQRATAKEAPSISMPVVLWPRKLGGRECHLLSRAEQAAALLALYHPDLFDLHEQRILHPGPRPHPLRSHPKCVGLELSGFRGTVAVAHDLGVLARHPKCRVTLKSGERAHAFFPYLGDLLLFLDDQAGPFCVNWSIKDRAESFVASAEKPASSRPEKKADGLLPRHTLEQTYYRDAGIPTRFIAGSSIQAELKDNLRVVFSEDFDLSTVARIDELLDHYRNAVGTRVAAFKVMKGAQLQFGHSIDLCRKALHAAIWQRSIKVDMFTPILMDRPLQRMRSDPISVYSDWFARG